MPCNSGVGLIPIIDGKVHHFGACGLVNGLAILTDTETRTLWDHITGEAFYGPLKGHQLVIFGIQLTTVEAVLEKTPDAPVFVSSFNNIQSRMLRFLGRNGYLNSKGLLAPPFHKTMNAEIDPRLPRLEQGLGVMHDGKGKFYPMRAIPKQGFVEDEWGGGTLLLARGEKDRVPYAEWKADQTRPMQMLSRWYGFSFTYPKCDIYNVDELS